MAKPGIPAQHINAIPPAFLDAQNIYNTYADQLGVDRDQFFMNLGDLPKEISSDIREKLLHSLGYEQFYRDHSQHFKVLKEYQEGSRGFGAFALPREEFTPGSATVEKLALQLQSFQVSHPDSTGTSRYTPSGRVTRPEYIEAAVDQWNNGFDMSRKHMMFDIETAGLQKETDIWQVSARLMENGKELGAETLHFRSNEMNIGSFGATTAGKPMRFEEFFDYLRGQGDPTASPITWIERNKFAEGITPFLKMSQQAEFIAGHNVPFDLSRLIYSIQQTAEYNDPKSTFRTLADEFIAKADPSKVVDTRMMAAMSLGDITLADEITRLDKYTRFSMENIMLQTSFLDDLERHINKAAGYSDEYTQGASNVGRAAIQGRIERGMHFGDIDTWFQEQAMLMMDRVRGGETNLMRTRTQDGTGYQYDVGGARRARIVASSAITPFTRMDHLSGDTPLQRMIEQTRSFSVGRAIDHNLAQTTMFHAGMFDSWMNDVITSTGDTAGRIRKGVDFADSYADVQRRAVAANIPFAGLSAAERAITTLMGQHTIGGLGAYSEMRQMVGDVTGTGIFQIADRVRTYGDEATNVSIPMELIRRAEREGKLFTSFDEALTGGEIRELQDVRLSPFRWDDPVRNARGKIINTRRHHDVAIVADAFTDQTDVDTFIDYLRGLETSDPGAFQKYGLTGQMEHIAQALKRNGVRYGIQIGTMQGAGSSVTKRLYNLLSQLNLGVDRSNPIVMRSFVFGGSDALGGSGIGHLGPAIATDVTGPGLMEDAAWEVRRDTLLHETNRARQLTEHAANELSGDPYYRSSVLAQRMMPNRNVQRTFRTVEKGLRNMPTKLGLAGLGAAAYYMYRRNKNQDEYDDPFEQMPYEEAMPAQPPQGAQITMQNSNQNPLATAGLIQALHETRTNHMKMGPEKYDHLF